MAKIRVHELAKELGVQSKDIITYVGEKDGAPLKAMNALSEADEKKIRDHFTAANAPASEPSSEAPKAQAPVKKKRNVSVVFNNGFKSKGGKAPHKPQGERRDKDVQSQENRPKRQSKRLMEAAAQDRAREEERKLRMAAEAEEAAQVKSAEANVAQDAPAPAEKKSETEAAPEKKVIKRENVFVNMRKKEEEKRKAKEKEAAEKKKNPNQGDRRGDNRGRGGDKKNFRRDDRRQDRPDNRNGQNRGNNNDNRDRNRTGRSSAPAASAIVDNNKSNNRKGQNNKNNNNDYRRDKRRGNRLDKSEKTFSLEKQSGHKKAHKTPQKAVEISNEVRTVTIAEVLTIKELADALKIPANTMVKNLLMKGKMYTLNQEIEFDEAEEIALEYNVICEQEEKVDVIEELLKEDIEDKDEDLVARPPVVCVMGHVDHGKTSLLDAIRNTHDIDTEAGGITQAIGAYVVGIDGRKITFLDTPGHEAFTAMRMRGAKSTDIAVLVVAADDGVMPQTVEAINHAKAAGIEVIVAINKIDKPSANIDRVKQELSEYELIPEDWGGSTIFVPVSAHTHEGIDELLEMILLTADVLELKANPNRKARGLVIESKLDKGKGVCATVLVQKGTLKVGQPIAAGEAYGKIRAMTDENGRRLKEAGPSIPVEIQGLNAVPNAGEVFVSPDSDKEARAFAETFIAENKNRLLSETKSRMSLDDLFSQIQAGNVKELELIVKADVQGSVEALKQSLEKLSNEEVVVKIIHSGVGAINESDVILASASNAVIIGFNVRPDASAKATAESEGVDVKLYSVIYNAIEDVEAAIKGMLEPIYEERVTGHAEIRQIFKASGVGNIAGSLILDGYVRKDSGIRLMRDGEMIFEGKLASLKHYKDDVKEAKAGYECGIVIENFDKIQEGDTIEAYSMVEIPRT